MTVLFCTAGRREVVEQRVWQVQRTDTLPQNTSYEGGYMKDELSAYQVLASCFTIASLGGFFAYLRSDKKFEVRYACAATFYTGIVGLVIGLLWYTWFEPENMFFLIGVSGLAGLGGSTAIDIVLKLLQTGGLTVNLKLSDKED